MGTFYPPRFRFVLADRGSASHPKRELRDNTVACSLLRDFLFVQRTKTPAAAVDRANRHLLSSLHVVPERSSFVTLPPASAVTDLPTPQGPEPGQRLEQAPCTPLLLMSRRRAWTFFGVRRFVKVQYLSAKIQSRVIHQWGARHTHRQSFVAY